MPPEPSHSFPPEVIGQIHEMAEIGRYEIRGWGAKRRVPTFDDLVFLTASLTRYPLEGYRERCDTTTVLGSRFASRPLELAIPITIAGMSFGALSAHAKEALGRAATAVGTSTTTGDGGMTPEERKASRLLVYQCLPSRYGFNLDDLRAADAIEVVIGQGAKPGGGGMLLGQKVSERVAAMRTLPPGIDQRSASRHPDWTGPDDLRIKIEELREATGWEKPVYVKLGATRVDHDVKLAVAAGADVVVVDGLQGGTGATQTVFIEHAGIPTLPAVRIAAEALREIGKQDEVQLIVSGGIRSGADIAKALALGATAVSIGVGALIALGCNRPTYRAEGADHDATADYTAIGTAPGYCHHCHTGLCPVGVTTQDPELESRLDPEVGARWVTNYLKALTMELTALARACGKSNVHHLEPDDLVALTVEAAAMAKVPLAETVELDEGGRLPDWRDVDLVVVMGGPMGVYDEAAHPWLAAEKRWISAAVRAGVPYFGVCLGAQLLAASLGAQVRTGSAPEVGVLPVTLTAAGQADPVASVMGDEFLALQWHGDTFGIPAGAVCLGRSSAYPHQAMRFGDVAYAVQFHVEVTDPMFAEWRHVPAYAASAQAALGAWGFDRLARAFAASRDAMAQAAERMFHSWLRQAGIHCSELC